MAATLPSLLQHNISQMETSIKTEKMTFQEEEDFDVNRWLDDGSLSSFPFSSSQSNSSNYTSSSNGFGTSNLTSNCNFNFQNNSQTNSQLPHHQLPSMGVPQGISTLQPNTHIPSHFIPYNVGNCGTIPSILAGQMSFPQMSAPQVYQLFAQFQTLFQKTPQDQNVQDDKKKKTVRSFVRRVRQTRPKVVEAKGAVQCKGRNRKKGTQCRNAALMEYMGPRPIYCAEHIELDPKSLYEKCKAGYQKEPGDNKGCKEVVLKEFGLCYKHYNQTTNELLRTNNLDKALKHQQRITEICKISLFYFFLHFLVNQLEREAAAAKRKDGDLYQRKNKLIPKFQEMKKLINSTIDQLKSKQDSDASTPSSSSSGLSADELESDRYPNSPVYSIQIEDSDLITLPDQPFSS